MLKSWLDQLRGRYELLFFVVGLMIVTVHFSLLGYQWGIGLLVGSTLLITGILGCLLRNRSKLNLRGISLWVWIPILLILLSSVVQGDILTSFTTLFLIGVFLVSRVEGQGVFLLLVPLALVTAIVAVPQALWDPISGGSGFTLNSGLAGTIIGFSLLFLEGKWRWLSIPLLIGLFFSADHWTVITLAILALVMLVTKTGYLTTKKVVVTLVLIGLVLSGGLWLTGLTQTLYGFTLTSDFQIQSTTPSPVDLGFNNRFQIDKQVIENIKILGYGTQLDPTIQENNRYQGLVHNVPLMITDDLGPIAGLSWLTLMGYALWKTKKYRYQLAFILIVSMFSYWFWLPTCLGTWTFALVGISLHNNNNVDICSST